MHLVGFISNRLSRDAQSTKYKKNSLTDSVVVVWGVDFDDKARPVVNQFSLLP